MGKYFHRPAIPLTIALMGGIALGSAVPGFGMWALAVVCGVAVIRCLLRGSAAVVSPLLLFAALGYLSLQPWVHPRFSENHVSRFLDTGPWELSGRVDARPLEFESRTNFILRVERIASDQEVHEVTGLLRVTVAGETSAIGQGDRVALRSRIRSIRNFRNPGGFDFQRSMAYRGVWGSAFVEAKDLAILEKQTEIGFLGMVDRARSAVARQIDQTGLGSEAAVLKALVIGDQSGIPADIRRAFTRTGTSHILAISGLHIAIVASASFAGIRWLLSWMPLVLRHAWLHKGTAVLTLIPVTLYALIAGFSPSTQRALIMVAIFLIAFLVARETDLMNTLAMAAIGILVVLPQSLFSISFQLSFGAVAAIVYGMERFSGAFSPGTVTESGRTARVRRGLFLFFAVSLFATWGTLPLGMFYFNIVSFVGLLANCAAIPLMGYLAVALGLTGALLGAVSTPAAVLCHQVNGIILSKSIALMELMADLPFAAARTVTPSLTEIVLFYSVSWAALYVITSSRHAAPQAAAAATREWACSNRTTSLEQRLVWMRQRLSTPEILRRISGRKAAIAVLVAGLAAGCVDAGYWLYQRFGRQDLRLTLLDVGQGSAVLLEFPAGRTALVDGGGFADPGAFDVGEQIVAPYLWRNKIATVDTLILTHPNSDHMNGLIFIADNFHARSLWTNGESRPTPGHAALMRTARKRGIALPLLADIPRNTELSAARLEVLYPPADFLCRVGENRWRRNENNNSLVVRASLGEVSILIPGDIMQPAEEELVSVAGDHLQSTVLIAPHHGSRTSSSDGFLEAVAPQAVLISCGTRSKIPHPAVLQRYQDHELVVFRTDRNGAIRLMTDGRRLTIEPLLGTGL